MASEDLPLPPLSAQSGLPSGMGGPDRGGPVSQKTAEELEQVFDVPVTVAAVLGSHRMSVGDMLRLQPGAVLELDRRVGEAIDIFVNDRLVARGEVVIVEDKLGVTMTEIIKAER